MKKEVHFLLKNIKHILNCSVGDNLQIPPELNIEKLVQIAVRHSVPYLLYYALEIGVSTLQLSQKQYNNLYQNAMYELARSCNQIEAAEELLMAFEKAELYVMAIKGICTKRHYPQPEMRSMGDLDILCRVEQQDKVKDAILSLEYEYEAEGRKHDHYSREPFLNIEMHREMVSSDSKYNAYYETIWDKAKPREGCKYVYELGLEDEYIYNLVHLAEHFQNGGVGIRFVMDVYIYNRIETMDWDYVKKELTKLGLWEFFGYSSKLAQKWFGEDVSYTEAEKDVLNQMESYIVANGTFGTMRNHAAVAVAKGGRGKFLLQVVFPNLKSMQSMFPWLKKWPILLPYSWVLRGIRSLLFRRGNVKTQMNKYKHGDAEYGQKLKQFFDTCGL